MTLSFPQWVAMVVVFVSRSLSFFPHLLTWWETSLREKERDISKSVISIFCRDWLLHAVKKSTMAGKNAKKQQPYQETLYFDDRKH